MIEELIQQQESTSNIVPNPWRRYFARGLDMSLYSLIVTVSLLYVLRINTDGKIFARYVEFFIASGLMILLEPLLLAKVGTTPGKWMFGLALRDKNRNKITYLMGLQRTFCVIKEGYGFNIPIYNIYKQFKSYETCAGENELPWDKDFSYELKDTKGLRIVGYIVSMVLIFALTMFIVFQAKLPINRGNITSEEYYENCNDFMSIHQIDNGQLLNAQGQWYQKPSNDGSVIFVGIEPLNHTVIYEQGSVQKVIIEIETTERCMIYNLENQLFMSFSSFVGADKSVSVFELYDDDITGYFRNCFNDFEFDIDNYKIKNTVEYNGYHYTGRFLAPDDNQEQYFYLSFIIERK
jgi:hypothetical protein